MAKARKKAKRRGRKKKEAHRNGRPPLDTRDWVPDFLAYIAQGLHASDAAEEAHVNPATPYRRRKEDEAFAAAWRAAALHGVEMLEEEMDRRGYHGYLEPVFHRGVIVGHIRKYSDQLLLARAKALKPEVYRDNAKFEHVGKGDTLLPGPVIYLPDNGRSDMDPEALPAPAVEPPPAEAVEGPKAEGAAS